MLGRDRAVRVGDRIAVGIVRGATEHLVDPIDQALGHDVFELLGVVVDVRPAHAHDLHQEQLDQAVAPQDQSGELFARGAQSHAAVRLVLREPGFGERLDHRRRRAGGDAERRGDLSHRDESLVRSQR